jgi:hypothetical protein
VGCIGGLRIEKKRRRKEEKKEQRGRKFLKIIHSFLKKEITNT